MFARRLPSFLGLLRCHKGGVIIEFAVVALVLLTTIIVIVEFSLIAFTYLVLEGSTNFGSRIGKTGYTVGDREDYIRSEVRRLSGGLIDVTQVSVEILAYRDFANVGKPEPCNNDDCSSFTDINGNGRWDADQGRADAGGAGDVVLYKTTYEWAPLTPIVGIMFKEGEEQVIRITAIATVRNEAF